MKIMYYLVLITLLFLLQHGSCDSNILSEDLLYKNYLDIEKDDIRQQIRDQRSVQISLDFHGVESYTISTLPFSFEIFNTVCVLIGNRVYTVNYFNEKFVLQPHSHLTKIDHDVSFIKSIPYRNSFLIVVAFTEGHSNIYIFEKTEWIFMQTIENEGAIVDLELFYYNNYLYMFVANSVTYLSVPSLLYEWTGSHFDEIEKTITQGPTSVEIFEDKDSIIITVTQNPMDDFKAGTLVYIYNSDGLRKIQFLDTAGAINAHSYQLKDEKYLIVTNSKSKSTLFFWDGQFFIEWLNYDQYDDNEITYLKIIEGQPLLFIINYRAINVYDPSPSGFQLISETGFTEKTNKILSFEVVNSNDYYFLFVTVISKHLQPEMYFIPFTLYLHPVSEMRNVEDEHLSGYNYILHCLSELEEKINYRNHLLEEMWIKTTQLLGPTEDTTPEKERVSQQENLSLTTEKIKTTIDAKQKFDLKDKTGKEKTRINDDTKKWEENERIYSKQNATKPKTDKVSVSKLDKTNNNSQKSGKVKSMNEKVFKDPNTKDKLELEFQENDKINTGKTLSSTEKYFEEDFVTEDWNTKWLSTEKPKVSNNTKIPPKGTIEHKPQIQESDKMNTEKSLSSTKKYSEDDFTTEVWDAKWLSTEKPKVSNNTKIPAKGTIKHKPQIQESDKTYTEKYSDDEFITTEDWDVMWSSTEKPKVYNTRIPPKDTKNENKPQMKQPHIETTTDQYITTEKIFSKETKVQEKMKTTDDKNIEDNKLKEKDLHTKISGNVHEKQNKTHEDFNIPTDKVSPNTKSVKTHDSKHKPGIHENKGDVDVDFDQTATEVPEGFEPDRNKLLSGTDKIVSYKDKILKHNDSFILKEAKDKASEKVSSEHDGFLIPEDLDIERGLDDLNKNLENIKEKVDAFESRIFQGNLIIRGNLFVKQAETPSIQARTINERAWTPELWLFNNKTQTIPLLNSNHEIVTTHLKVTDPFSPLYGVVLKEGDQIIKGPRELHSLTANNIKVSTINDVNFEDIYLQNSLDKITGVKEFDKLSAENLTLTTLKDKDINHIINMIINGYDFGDQISIENLNVDVINGVKWKEFTDSLIQGGYKNVIHGDLIIDSDVEIDHLVADTLSGIDISKIFTTSTDQELHSDFQLYNIIANYVSGDDINGIDFSEDVATIADDKVIAGPVSIKNINVLGNLNVHKGMENDEHEEHKRNNNFLQFYSGQVKIFGDLHIGNLNLKDSCEIYHGDKHFDFANIKNEYWLKNTDQVIPNAVTFKNISTAHVTTQFVNNHQIESFIKTTEKELGISHITFENLIVEGNLTTKIQFQQDSLLKKLIEDTVKKSGYSFKVKGHKVYSNEITIDKLHTRFLDKADATNIANIRSLNSISESMHFEKIIIKNGLHITGNESAKINSINNINLKDLQERTIYINKDHNIRHLEMQNVTAIDITFQYLNDLPIQEVMVNVTDMYATGHVKKMVITGDVQIKKANIQYLNSIDVNNYLSNVAYMNTTPKIEGKIKFLGTPYIENLQASLINNVNIYDMAENYLSRNKNQTITAKYYFDEIFCEHLQTPLINNFDVNNLIVNNINTDIYINGTLHFDDLYVEGGINAKVFNCDIRNGVEMVHNPSSRHWPYVSSKVAFVEDDTGALSDILNKVVHNKIARPIEGKVTVEYLSVDRLQMSQPIINDVDIQFIFEDALMRNVPNQVIVGHKTFRSLSGNKASVLKNAHTPFVNNIDMLDLNTSVIYMDAINHVIIHGNKEFSGGLYVKNLKIPGKIHGVLPKNLVSLSNMTDLPHTHFTNLRVSNDFNFEYINDVLFNDIMLNRLLKKSENPQFVSVPVTFDHIHITGASYIESINGLKVNDMVTDEGTQHISAYKRFTEPVTINGDLYVDLINGYDITKEYNNAALIGDHVIELQKNLVFENSVDMYADINTSSINGIKISTLDRILLTDLRSATHKNKDSIFELNSLLQELDMSKREEHELLYIENTYDLNIAIPNSVDAHVMKLNNEVQLNIVGQESGEKCGLPSDCYCPAQYVIRLTPQVSYDTLIHNDSNRFFGYYENGHGINLITNSSSNSPVCRKHDDELEMETTYITWYGHDQFEPHYKYVYNTGYVRDAQFFTINGITYLVVIRFYDPLLDTYNLHCDIMRASDNELDFVKIQSIETKGAWALNIFHTAQGVTLIIGNTYDSKEVTSLVDSEIYRFHEDTEQFILIRTIASRGVTDAVGVAIEDGDSLIMLAKHYTVLVLKYDDAYDDYLFFQNIRFESSVLGLTALQTSDSSEVYLGASTYSGQFYLYSFKYIEGWKLEFSGNLDGLQTLIPFVLNKQPYFFAPSTKHSKILKVATQGLN